MEFIVIIVASIIALLVLLFVYNINYKIVNKIKNNEELNNLAVKFPPNIKICKTILKMLGNEKVKVEENLGATASLYIAVSDKISIANTKDNYTRIQTVAHECIHSIQDRRMLLFNFFYTNVYLLYFCTTIILMIFKILPSPMTFLTILIILGIIQFAIRSYLENDAMIKAEYLAKEYMEKEKILTTEEVNKIVNSYHEINPTGIKATNYSLLVNMFIKVVIFSIIALIV